MLYDTDHIRAVVQALASHYDSNTPPLVCDPVCVSTSGHKLLNPEALDTLIKELLPLATIITPNQAEAELLLAQRRTALKQISNLEDMLSAARSLCEFGSRAVLLKGGHVFLSIADLDRVSSEQLGIKIMRYNLRDENTEILHPDSDGALSDGLVVDVLYEAVGQEVTIFARPRINSKNTHGTGCTLSSAIAASLAHGRDCSFLMV